MQTLINKIAPESQPWFKTWFDSAYYHSLYQHRNDKEAQSFINYLLNELSPAPGATMLDLGCGAGRHSKYLASKGYNVTGLDLAFSSIRRAKKWENETLRFFQHDMRIPFGFRRFDFVFNFFTSFGYFKSRTENNKVVANISQALKPGGVVMFDYLNVAYVEEHLIPEEEKEIDGVVYRISRWTDHDFIFKRIAVYDSQLPQPLEYIEQVARFTVADFSRFFERNKLQTINVFGDYD